MTILTLNHKTQPHWFERHFQFNPIILSLSRQRLLKIVTQQRKAMISMDKITWENTLWEIRRQLMRRDFQANFVGCLFVLLEQAGYWGKNASANIAWTAFLMLKGCAVEIKSAEREPAMSLCTCVLALAGVPVHWIVADEHRAILLAEKNADIFRALHLESPVALIDIQKTEKVAISTKPVIIVTAEHLAQNYLQNWLLLGTKQRRLKLLLNQLSQQNLPSSQLPILDLSFALIENIDFWLMEKAFSVVEITTSSKQQITLHELFRHYWRCAGNLFGSQNLAYPLWNSYHITPVTLSHCQKKTAMHCTVFQNLAQKWQAIATKLVQAKQTGEKICLIVTTAESLEQVRKIGLELALPIKKVKLMQSDAANEFAMNNLLVLGEPFPWLGIEEWLNQTNCQLVIVDFYDSYRLWYYLEQLNCFSPTISIDMLFSLEDNWLQQLETLSIHKWFQRSLKWQPTVSGSIAYWLIKRLLAQAEDRREKIYTEMSHWLWQKEKMFPKKNPVMK